MVWPLVSPMAPHGWLGPLSMSFPGHSPQKVKYNDSHPVL